MSSSFARRFSLTAGMIILNSILLATSFCSLFYGYMVRQERKSLSQNANVISSYAGTAEDFSSQNTWDLQIVLNYGASVSDTDVLLCDTSGVVMLCTCEDFICNHLGQTLPAEMIGKAASNGYSYATGTLKDIYSTDRYLYAKPVLSTEDEHLLGYVVVSSEKSDLNSMLTSIFWELLLAMAVVLLMALLVTTVITRRETATIREISLAAKQFAHGDFSARIRAEGADQETLELATAFNNMADSLEKSESLRQEFISNVSHELKTPMTTIAGFMDGMLDGTIPKEKHAYYMATVSAEVKRLNRMVRSMLDISRMKSTGEDVVKARFDVTETLGRTLLTFEQKIEAKHLDVEVNMPDRSVYVLANEDSITQVIYNLIDNAVKFATEGTVMQLGINPSGNKALVSVANAGPTIPPEELPQVFDRFHKSDKSRSMDTTGVGLGLYIVRTILGNHGEDISVESQDGVTTFTFTLELDKQKAENKKQT